MQTTSQLLNHNPLNPDFFMFNLFNSGTKYQKIARQNNCNLVESNGYWYLYQDGQLVARETTPQNAIQILTK